MFKSLNKINSEQAHDILHETNDLNNYYISGRLDFSQKIAKDSPVVISNCFCEELYCPSAEFNSELQLLNSFFYRASFSYTYFLKGLLIRNCVFPDYLDFQAGGHNLSGILIEETTFYDFVNFFDCWFKSDVVVRNNFFKKGSNLLGNKGEHYEVKFDRAPSVHDNIGSLELDGEGH